MMPGFLRAEATYRTRLLQLAVVAVTAAFAVVLAAQTLFTKADRLAYTNNVPARVPAACDRPARADVPRISCCFRRGRQALRLLVAADRREAGPASP